MNKLNLHYCYWLSGKFAEKLSVWGILGLLISMSCLIFYLVQVVPLEQKIKFAQQNTVAREYKKVFTTYPFSDPDPIPKPDSKIYPYFRFDGFLHWCK